MLEWVVCGVLLYFYYLCFKFSITSYVRINILVYGLGRVEMAWTPSDSPTFGRWQEFFSKDLGCNGFVPSMFLKNVLVKQSVLPRGLVSG